MKKYLQLIAELNLTGPKTIVYNAIYALMKTILSDDDLSFIDCNSLLKKLTNLL